MVRRLLATSLAAVLPFAAGAHPHLFIDAGLTLVVDGENRLVEVRLSRAFDAFYSLVELSDRGLDPDGDGVLTEAEAAALLGFDLGYAGSEEGDLYLTRDGAGLGLSEPEAVSVALEDGLIVSTQARRLETPVALDDAVTVKVYDVTYYAAYTLTRGVVVEGGAGCEATVARADLDAAYSLVEEMLYGAGAQNYDEDSYPEVGEAFADTVTLRCTPGS